MLFKRNLNRRKNYWTKATKGHRKSTVYIQKKHWLKIKEISKAEGITITEILSQALGGWIDARKG